MLIVDESKPSAAAHELGHGLGLFLTSEQYALWPPSGRRMEGVTSFPTPDDAGGRIDAILHHPAPWYSWFFESGYFDIMSAGDTVWANPEYVAAFIAYLGLRAPPGAALASGAPGAWAWGGASMGRPCRHPASAVAFSTVRVHDEREVLRVVGAGSLSNRFLSPTAGGIVGCGP